MLVWSGFANVYSVSLIQLVCLNLSNNRLYKLDDLAELVSKAPNLKTLNLSQNEVSGPGVVLCLFWGGGVALQCSVCICSHV